MKWLKTWKISPGLTAIMILFILLPPPAVFLAPQYPDFGRHQHSAKDLGFWEKEGRLIPVRITEIRQREVNGTKTAPSPYVLYWLFEGQRAIELGSFEIYPDDVRIYDNKQKEMTIVQLEQQHKGEWLIFYCDICKQALIISWIRKEET